mmetsp:Transcript_10012/g.23875  ORF Transcript_10012/g.23875 Transcript_10012/m.23875 type:complete len:317 (-) Transcript_10012:118-1068(-)
MMVSLTAFRFSQARATAGCWYGSRVAGAAPTTRRARSLTHPRQSPHFFQTQKVSLTCPAGRTTRSSAEGGPWWLSTTARATATSGTPPPSLSPGTAPARLTSRSAGRATWTASSSGSPRRTSAPVRARGASRAAAAPGASACSHGCTHCGSGSASPAFCSTATWGSSRPTSAPLCVTSLGPAARRRGRCSGRRSGSSGASRGRRTRSRSSRWTRWPALTAGNRSTLAGTTTSCSGAITPLSRPAMPRTRRPTCGPPGSSTASSQGSSRRSSRATKTCPSGSAASSSLGRTTALSRLQSSTTRRSARGTATRPLSRS